MARELHDDISQRLATLSMEGDDILRNLSADTAGAHQRLDQLLAKLGQLSEDVRMLSHGLHPAMIEDLGLAPALRISTNEFGEREGMIASFFPQDVPEELPLEVATGLYRIAQEALRNVSKHAGKTHVRVLLTGKEDGVEMQVADSGRGFDRQRYRTGLGLISVEERARLIGATVKIESVPREGTKVTVYVPLDTRASKAR